MRRLLLVALALSPGSAHATVYSIGNSLTNDASVWNLEGVGYHIRGGASLGTIHSDPSTYAGVWPTPWNVALASTQFDYVTVQPYGGTVASNVAAISAWMTLQPDATFVVHTSWPALSQFTPASVQAILDHAEQIMAGVRAANPGRTIYRDKAVDALLTVYNDVASGTAPFASFGEIYRDDLHLTGDSPTGPPTDNGEGRYLIHQVLRHAVGQAPKTTIYTSIPADTRAYLNGVVAQVTAVPEASQLLMGAAAAGLAACGLLIGRRRQQQTQG